MRSLFFLYQKYGQIQKVITSKGDQFGLAVAAYQIDTTSGQYGAPIQLKDKTGKVETIGVHAGYGGALGSDADNKFNVGTIIT